jgi:putative ABC transport system ATP-binding protein
MTILKALNINKSFFIENKEIKVLSDITFNVNEGEFIAITGSSGSGKSTLLSIIAGLDKPDLGTVEISGKNITSQSEEELSNMRNQDMGFVFQSFLLIPSLTAYENVYFPSELSKKNDNESTLRLLTQVDMLKRKDNYPIQLSGGEKQRIAIARALINKPKILFADEPTGNLDSKNGEKIMELLISLQKEFNLTLIIVTHEKKISDKASRVIELKDGKIIIDVNKNKVNNKRVIK